MNRSLGVNALGGSGFKCRSRKRRAWMLSVVSGTKTQSQKLLAGHPTDAVNFLPTKKFLYFGLVITDGLYPPGR